MDCINTVWFNRLLLVRIIWAKGKASQWLRSTLFSFVWRLFSPLSHTKFSQEYLLQDLQNLSRGNRKQEARMVRVKYAACSSKRLESCNVKMMQLQAGDLCALGDLQSVKEQDFHPPSLKSVRDRKDKNQLISKCVEVLKSPVKDMGHQTVAYVQVLRST